MLTIRDTQFLSLSLDLQLRNPRPYLDHLNQRHPEWVAEHDDAEALELVRGAVRGAHGYALSSTRDVCRFLDLVVIFGPDWSGEANAWLHQSLAGATPENASRQLGRLLQQAMSRLEAAAA
ncbi:hypothetical protein [Comamonas sp. JC664]|uniref:hypothetical protein n=1 Tax=Comamonas sp. JC664 TaxID=2801917 RepID=UPI00174D4BD0|nr:hypothetical protein [Comamonas sp. JC664]MBL0695497.1 hypothetical protein [Comamonas sp. JC664]GHG61839.1 hypothetical protein GCM10012319_00060 [Comamonas sp. KCTC 72670]